MADVDKLLEKIVDLQAGVDKLRKSIQELSEDLNDYISVNKRTIQKDVADSTIFARNLSMLEQTVKVLLEVAVNLQELYYELYAFENLKKPQAKDNQ